MSSSQGPPAPSLPPKPEASTSPPPEEPRTDASKEDPRPLLSRMGPSVRYDSRDRNADWDREKDRERERDRFRDYDRDRDSRGRGRGRGFGRGGLRRDWSPPRRGGRDDDRRPPFIRDRSPPPRRRDFSPPRRGGRPFYDDRRSGPPYRSDYRDSRPFREPLCLFYIRKRTDMDSEASSSRRPSSPSWRQRDRSPRPRRTPPPYRPRSRSRDRRRPSSRSPSRRTPSPRKGPLSHRSRSRSPPRRRSPLSARRSRSRSSSRSARRSASPPKVVSRLPPIGAPTGPRLNRIPHGHPSYGPYPTAQYLPRETPEPRYAPTKSTVDAPMEELELGQVEPEVTVRDEAMDVEPVKHEEPIPTESIDPLATRDSVELKRSDSPIQPPPRPRSPSPELPMAVDEQKPDINPPSPKQSSPAPVKAEPIQQVVKPEVKAEPSNPTRPRRTFADSPPSRESNRTGRASPAPRTESKYQRRDRHDQYQPQSSPASSHYTKGSPRSPRPPFKGEERSYEPSKLSSAAHTPSIPSQELGGSTTHSPKPHLDAPQLERALSSSASEPVAPQKPGFMRMGTRTEHGNGPSHGRPPHAQREGAHNQQTEEERS